MIELKTGDILRADVEVLVNTVNCVCILGRGTALQFKDNFPENFKAYEADRKKRFSPRQICITFETLHAKGWLAAA